MSTLKKIETVLNPVESVESVEVVKFDALGEGNKLKGAIRARAGNEGRMLGNELTAADAAFALVSNPGELRALSFRNVKAENYKLTTEKGALEFLMARFELKIDLRQMRRCLTTGAARAWIMNNVIDPKTDEKVTADSKLLPESWAAGDAFTKKIETPNELTKEGTWRPRAHKATANAQIVKHVAKGDKGIDAEMKKRAKAYPENLAKGMSQLEAATEAAKGPDKPKTPEKAESECKATIKAVLAKLARTARTTKSPKATLTAYVKTMVGLMDPKAQAKALKTAADKAQAEADKEAEKAAD